LLGCHDKGYATSLRSLITAGFQDKLILLRSYKESATGIEELGLPSVLIPHLFVAEKLVASHGPLPGFKPGRSRSASFADSLPQLVPRSITPLPPSSLQSSCTFVEDPKPTEFPPGLSPEEELDQALPFATEIMTTVARPAVSPSYRSALQAVQPVQSRASSPEFDTSDSSESSDISDDFPTDPRTSPSLSRARHVNPNIVEYTPTILTLWLINRIVVTATFKA
jgi:hypothetical protein